MERLRQPNPLCPSAHIGPGYQIPEGLSGRLDSDPSCHLGVAVSAGALTTAQSQIKAILSS